MSAVLRNLHFAVVSGNIDEVRGVVHSRNVNYIDTVEGLSLLSWAVSLQNVEMAQLLLSRGASCSLCDRNGFQPIHRAVWTGNAEMVRLLLDNGADSSAMHRKNKRTPLALAAISGNVEIAKLLLAYRPPPFSSATATNAAVDIDFRDDSGKSALDLAASSGNKEMVDFLMSSGADAFYSRVCANEGSENARTWSERYAYDDINKLLCQAWSKQSEVSM